jgi:hypothetical protein
MIPVPELQINHLLEIHRNSVHWFFKKNLDTTSCLHGQLEDLHQQIDALKSTDEQQRFFLDHFSLFAHSVYHIDNEIKNFNHGYAAIKDIVSGKWGFIDIRLKLVIPFKYDEVEDFNAFGHANVKLNGNWGLINKKNKFFQFEYKDANALLFLTYEV